MITLIFYSILKYRLFNIKVIATELLIFSLWIFISIRIFLATSIHEILIECCILLFTIVIGLITIRGTLKEITHREEIEILASDLKSLNSTLSQKVAEQTAEVRKAYELEKHARRDLEKLNETKDQFIMITQHHLRTPVTSIRWELESMLNGTYGRVGAMLKQALNDTNTSVARLTRIVDDFLNITALKVGSQILNIETGNLKPLVEDVINELKIDIGNMHLSVDYLHNGASWPDLQIDAGKMREVLLIILENAVKYNVDGGTIQIKTRLVEDNAGRMFGMTIENTGVGLTTEDKEKLFTRHFFRSKRAQAANPIGMGIGLSVARAVVRAHHGDLAIESAGENTGAKVMLKLPL
jgi:signal transduction histidine kinase